MENPDYTERQINEALKEHTPLDITVMWDGYEPERGGTADFEVYLDGETTDLVVWDHGTSFDIYARTGERRYTSKGWAGPGSNLYMLMSDWIWIQPGTC